jgi:hypothetical protein
MLLSFAILVNSFNIFLFKIYNFINHFEAFFKFKDTLINHFTQSSIHLYEAGIGKHAKRADGWQFEFACEAKQACIENHPFP